MPVFLRDWAIAAIAVFTLSLAVALEIGLFISNKQGGEWYFYLSGVVAGSEYWFV